MIPKLLSFTGIVLGSIIIGILYGILNDHLTYSISYEYYTKFKFIQFGLVSDEMQHTIIKPRLLVTLTGIIATWWIGLIIGLVLGVITFFLQNNWKSMLKIYFKIISIVFVITLGLGIIGLGIGFLFFNDNYFENQFLTVINQKSFYAVGFMHNFSYVGGLCGLLFGIYYNFKNK